MYVFKLGKDFYWKSDPRFAEQAVSQITCHLDDATFFEGYTPDDLKKKYDWLIESGFKLVEILEEEV